MTIVRTDEFERAFRRLPQEIKRLYGVQENRFSENWRDSRLHIKKVRDFGDAFSFFSFLRFPAKIISSKGEYLSAKV